MTAPSDEWCATLKERGDLWILGCLLVLNRRITRAFKQAIGTGLLELYKEELR